MTTIDIIIVIIIGAGAIMGLFKGFIKQLAMIAGLVVGLIAAKALYISLAEKICPTVTDSMTVAQIISFVVIWMAVPLAFTLVAALFSKALEAVSLGAVNRLLGLVLGALKYVILIGLFINVLEFVDSDNRLISRTNKEQSVLYYPMKNFVGMFFPAVKEVTQQYIN
jgi:colicin V production protein